MTPITGLEKKNSLADNDVDGHERLLNMVNEFYHTTGREQELENLYKDNDLLLECDNMAGGNVFGIDPATGLKVAVDALDEYMSEDEVSDHTVIPVHEEENDNFSSKPENLDELQGGENEMGLADDLDTLDLAQEDHYNAAERMDNALEEYGNTAEAAEAVAEELATVYDLQGKAAESVVGSMTDYLMDHRAHMDDTALELLEGAEDVRETLDDIDVPNDDDVMDAVHVAARIERNTEEDYDFNF